MAEIRVQERRGNPLWVWVLILLVVVAALVWFFMLRDPAGPAAAAPADTVRSLVPAALRGLLPALVAA